MANRKAAKRRDGRHIDTGGDRRGEIKRTRRSEPREQRRFVSAVHIIMVDSRRVWPFRFDGVTDVRTVWNYCILPFSLSRFVRLHPFPSLITEADTTPTRMRLARSQSPDNDGRHFVRNSMEIRRPGNSVTLIINARPTRCFFIIFFLFFSSSNLPRRTRRPN